MSTRFALFFGNRGFFPASLIKGAREDLTNVLAENGYESLILAENATNHGAVESVSEGEIYAKFLEENKGKYDGVILCLPNFGDETGAVAALKDAGVPILIQAYPDEIDKMSPAERRDAFCGKFSIMDVFCQYGVKFTAVKPHTVHPGSKEFVRQLDYFARVCQVVKGMKNLVVGAIGARTTAFKTVRIDELALQKAGITVETFDLSMLIAQVKNMESSGEEYNQAKERLLAASDWSAVPENALDNLVKLSVAIKQLKEQENLDAVAVRCWIELQQQLAISPCVLLSDFNNQGITAACEVDVGNAIAMQALRLAADEPAMCLDWNNNYGDDENKCVLFHCGPIAFCHMAGKGKVEDHSILASVLGPGCSFGPNTGRIKPMDMTFASLLTNDGKLDWFLGEGKFTEDQLPDNFFGCGGVVEMEQMQDVLLHVGKRGFRHHVSVAPGHHLEAVREALTNYLDMRVSVPQKGDGMNN